MIRRALAAAAFAVTTAATVAVAQPVEAPPPVEAPLDPYAAPAPAKPAKPAKPRKPVKAPKPAKPTSTPPVDAGPAPLDPYAAPAPVAAPGPVDPYAAPVRAPAVPVSRNPYEPPAPRDPVAPTVVDPYASAGKPVAGKPVAGKPPVVTPPPTAPTPVDPYAAAASSPRGRIDVAAVQGLLALQSLDGWLLTDRGGANPIAASLVELSGSTSRRWFYLVPRTGEPTLVVHAAEVASFAAVPGRRVTYASHRDLGPVLKKVLKGRRALAMEYSPRDELPSISRVDAGTLELVRAAGVAVKPSHALVQFAKASWGLEGRKAHYLAAHHLTELRKDALSFLAERLRTGVAVTERDVVARIERGMAVRGLVGPPPTVAFGKHTADPAYVPTAASDVALQRGDVILLGLAGKTAGGVYAATTWIAVADAIVSPRVAELFAAATGARDAVIALIRDRLSRRRAVAGWEVDRAAATALTFSGLGDLVLHRTGHSLDTDLFGAGADLDDTEVHDPRALTTGTGFTIGPGLYVAGQLGVRTEVSAFLGKDGLEVTTPAQSKLELLLGE